MDFVPKAHPLPPKWLAWSSEEWERFGTLWWDSIDEHLNILTYLRKYFHSDDRLSAAQADVDVATSNLAVDAENADLQEKLAGAKRWQARVLLWQSSLLQDLSEDSVAAPGTTDRRWLLHRGGVHSIDRATGVLRCDLCVPCRCALSNKESATSKPAMKMPECVRARGFDRVLTLAVP